jgi:Flp pilus assembly protein TadD
MTLRRLLVGFVLALALQGTVFAWQYRDLLYLRQPLSAIDREGRDAFVRNATSALSRDTLTRRHLDTIAEAAVRFGTPAIEIRALIRRSELDPQDAGVKVRLGDALRRAGHFDAAERVYNEVLSLNRRRP